MKYLLTILILIPFDFGNHDRLKVIWRPDEYHEPRVFYPDSLEYLNNGCVNIWVGGKVYNYEDLN